MKNIRSFAILGGDLRSGKLGQLLKMDGNNVNIFGNKQEINNVKSIKEAIENVDIVIGPLPCSEDSEYLFAPFCENKILLSDIFKSMNKNQIFIGGRIETKLHHLAEIYNVYIVDLLEREEMAVLNAIPTAEGAIQVAMQNTDTTLHDSNALILGFGRIGKTLAEKLEGLGVNVCVAARKYPDVSWIKSYGYKGIFFNELDNYLSDFDIIFNTVPVTVLDSKRLMNVSKNTLIIDLASAPGGIDFEKAKESGITVIWALSLPGKVAPTTAAKYIKDTIYYILEDLGL